MSDFGIKDMQEMQRTLQNRYKISGNRSLLKPENAQNGLLHQGRRPYSL